MTKNKVFLKNMKYNFDTLKNYALWYYFKYFPSSKRLIEKLNEKSFDTELSKKVFENIKHLINERQVIWDKIRLFLLRNKNLKYIKLKLLEKWFDKNLVEEILQNDFLEDWKSLLNEKSLYIKIENYKNAWKSINYIKQKLIERSQDRELVENIMTSIFENWEEISIKKEAEKLLKKYDKVKVTQKLIAKGFRYNEVRRVLND